MLSHKCWREVTNHLLHLQPRYQLATFATRANCCLNGKALPSSTLRSSLLKQFLTGTCSPVGSNLFPCALPQGSWTSKTSQDQIKGSTGSLSPSVFSHYDSCCINSKTFSLFFHLLQRNLQKSFTYLQLQLGSDFPNYFPLHSNTVFMFSTETCPCLHPPYPSLFLWTDSGIPHSSKPAACSTLVFLHTGKFWVLVHFEDAVLEEQPAPLGPSAL